MKALLNALQEGRLVELPPESDKEQALQFLGNLIAAIPDVPVDNDALFRSIMEREQSGNTGIGRGVACPHARASGVGEMVCAVGWAPAGLDYGAADGQKVHLVLLYYIPDNQKTSYLKEVSSLVQAIRRDESSVEMLAKSESIGLVRNKLLDWVSAALEAGQPQARARMIRLEARQAEAPPATATLAGRALQIIPFSCLLMPEGRQFILSHDLGLVGKLEADASLPGLLQHSEEFDLLGYHVVRRSANSFASDRQFYECLAVRLNAVTPA